MADQLALQLERPAIEAARAMGTEGMRRAEARAERESPGFAAEAYTFLCSYARTHSGAFSSEDAVEIARVVGIVPADARAWGGVFQRAARAGVIVASDELYRRANGHGTWARKWRRA